MLAVTLLATAVGCQSPHYRAASLPESLRVAPTKHAKQVHLASFAVAAPDSSLLAPGDLLKVAIESGLDEERSEPFDARVGEDGLVELPIVGAVRVAGLEPADAGRVIRDEAVRRGVFRRPSINVAVEEKATNRVTVLGAVAEPGVHELPVSASSVVNAIAVAGGLTEEAAYDIEVVRQPAPYFAAAPTTTGGVELASHQAPAAPVTERISLAQAQQLTPRQRSVSDGDVIMVPEKQTRQVFVSGLVASPGAFELPDDQDLRVLDALALAGGRTSPVADRVLVIRQRENGEPAVIRVSVSQAKTHGAENLVLGAGDMVSVENTAATSTLNAVKNFLRVTLGVTGNAVNF